jgi:hypothetical protein
MRLGLLTPAQRPAFGEAWPAPFRKADVDDIEVPWDDRLGEDGSRLPGDLGAEVAVREVGEGEHVDAGGPGELGGAESRRVERVVRTRAFLGGEGGLVHEDIGVPGCIKDRPCRTGIAREHDLSARPRSAEHLIRDYRCPAGHGDRLAGL